MAVTLTEICNGIETALGAAVGMRSSTSFDEMTEGIAPLDCPRVEVYWEDSNCDPSGRADRTAFSAGVQQSAITIIADCYARQRSQLGEDMKATVEIADAIIEVLQAQERPPFFGVPGIKAFSWRGRKAGFKRADARYVGARFTILCRVF